MTFIIVKGHLLVESSLGVAVDPKLGPFNLTKYSQPTLGDGKATIFFNYRKVNFVKVI